MEQTMMTLQVPKGLWAAFLYEMKKYKTFRAGYQDGKLNLLRSMMLLPQSDTSYRHKFGVLVACFEAGAITDLRLERETMAVRAYKGDQCIYEFIGRAEGRTQWNRKL